MYTTAQIRIKTRIQYFEKAFEKAYGVKVTPKSVRYYSANLCVSFTRYIDIWFHPVIFKWGSGEYPLRRNCTGFNHIWRADWIVWKLTNENNPVDNDWTRPMVTGSEDWTCPKDIQEEFMRRFKDD
jgi:hypothetical protein